MSIKAAYAGSFDPFTIGHLTIAIEAAEIFDELHILIAANSMKERRTDVKTMLQMTQQATKDNPKIRVLISSGLVADYCRENHISYVVRGLRNTSDYMYEESIAKINQEINPDLKTVYLRAANDVISSSMVWELLSNGKPVQKYLPYPEGALIETL